MWLVIFLKPLLMKWNMVEDFDQLADVGLSLVERAAARSSQSGTRDIPNGTLWNVPPLRVFGEYGDHARYALSFARYRAATGCSWDTM